MFALLVLLRDYSNSFNLFSVAELSSNRTGGNGIQGQTKNGKFTVVCSRSPQNPEFGHFTLLFGRVWRRNAPKFKTHVQGLCFTLCTIGGFHVTSSPPCWWTNTIDLSLAPFVRPPAFVRFTIVICVSRDWLKTTYCFVTLPSP